LVFPLVIYDTHPKQFCCVCVTCPYCCIIRFTVTFCSVPTIRSCLISCFLFHSTLSVISKRKLGNFVFLICIWDVPGSNITLNAHNRQYLQADARMVPQQPIPSISFPIHC
jgi:hypothetical protein